MPGEVTTQEILRKAADVIRTNGWWQGDYYEMDAGPANECKVCALGAIGVAAGCDLEELPLDDRAIPAARVFAEYLDLPVDDCTGRADLIALVGNWNDNPLQTASQVIAALLVAGGADV